MKKFEFFEKEDQVIREKPGNTSKIKMKEISPKQMYSIKGILFLTANTRIIENNILKQESLIVKIINNTIVDEYRIFNKMIYHFQIKEFNEKNYFVSIGGDFDLHNFQQDRKQQYFMITSIKLFDATKIIPVSSVLNPPETIFDKEFLIKKINLLYSVSFKAFVHIKDYKFLTKDLESFQNVLSFAINDDFNMCAVGLDKGRIILIVGRPNLFACPEEKLLIRFLSQIEDELHITNLAFSFVNIQGNIIDILYATTTKDIFYFIFPSDDKDQIERLNQDENEIGAYSGCIAVNGNSLLIGCTTKTSLIEYVNLERGPSWFFEGRKLFVSYFKNYIVFVINEESSKIYSLNIYDRDNRFLAYNNHNFNRITGLCYDEDNIQVFVENETPEINKYVLTLREKDNKEKFTIFYNKNFYDTAVEYAKNLKYDKQKISEISKKYAEHLYSKGEYKNSIEQFILTINYLDPSYVIQKFLEKKKLVYLIQYLEALDKDETFKTRDPDEIKDYTALLLNCYIMEEKTSSLNTFLKDRNNSFQLVDIQTVIDICAEANQQNLALSIAEKTNKIDGYLNIMINKNQKKAALEKIENETSLKVKFDLLCKYGKDLITDEKNEKDNKPSELLPSIKKLIKSLILSIISFRDNGKDVKDIKYEELLKIFLDTQYEKDLSELLDYIIDNDEKCPGSIIHRRIEIYLDKLTSGCKYIEEAKEKEEKKIEPLVKDNIGQGTDKIKEEILLLLNNPKYKDRINLSYIYILFSSKEQEEKDKRLNKVINTKNVKIEEVKGAKTKKLDELNRELTNQKEETEEKKKERAKIAEEEETYCSNEIKNCQERLYKTEVARSIFPEGMIAVLEKMEQRQELLFIYLETNNYEAIVKEIEKQSKMNTKNNTEFEKTLLWSFSGLVDKIIDQQSYNEVFPYVETLIDPITKSNIPSLKVLHILKGNKMMKFKSIKKFMKEAITKENERINVGKKAFEENFTKLENAKNEIRDIKIKCITFKPNKCSICTRQLSLPAVYFFCQHAYDLSCINRDTINDMTTTGCSKCFELNIKENSRKGENEDAAKDHKKFKENLMMKTNKFEYTMSMLKEGIMVLGNQQFKRPYSK